MLMTSPDTQIYCARQMAAHNTTTVDHSTMELYSGHHGNNDDHSIHHLDYLADPKHPTVCYHKHRGTQTVVAQDTWQTVD